ncbi:MAG: TIGR02996 domain-containing protein [Kofleriaceae bacterium]
MAKAKAASKKKQPKAAPVKLRLYATIKGKKDTVETHQLDLELAGTKVAMQVGPPYGKRTAKTFSFTTPEKAKAKLDALLAEYRATGFRALGEIDPPAIPVARDEALEAAIREDRDDPAPYLVYADWLQAKGSPIGEMLVFAQRKKPKQALAIARKLGLPSPDMATFGWRHGLWQWLRLDNDIDSMAPAWDPTPFVQSLFSSPLCAALEELRIGMMRWDHNDQPAAIALAGKYGWARDLRALRVGDVDRNIDMDHHSIGDVGKAISKAFPNLVTLKLHSGSQSWRGGPETFGVAGLDLPHLTDLVVETCAMNTKRMKSLASAKLPELAKLELWFGAKDRDGTARVADVAPIFARVFPKLTHLGLRNSELVTDFVRLLPGSKLAKQLVSLDLSMGTMSDDDARELAEGGKHFPALTSLNVGDSYVGKPGLAALKQAFPRVKIESSTSKEVDDDYPSRYVSVHE